jgi:hypothetical protein
MKKLFWSLATIQALSLISIGIIATNFTVPASKKVDLSRFTKINLKPQPKQLIHPSVEILAHDLVVEKIYEQVKIMPQRAPVIRKPEMIEDVVVKRVSAVERGPKKEVKEKPILLANNSERFQHYGFNDNSNSQKVQLVTWSHYFESSNINDTLESLALAYEETEPLVHAEEAEQDLLLSMAMNIENQLSGMTEELPLVSTHSSDNDELVLIDYSEEKAEQSNDPLLSIQNKVVASLNTAPQPQVNNMIDDLIGEQKISEEVTLAIDRELQRRSVKAEASASIPASAQAPVPKSAAPALAAVTTQPSTVKRDEVGETMSSHDRANQGASGIMSSHDTSRNIIRPYQVMLDRANEMSSIRNVEFFVETSQSDRFTDSGSGSILAEYNLASSKSVVRGTLLSHGYVRTKLELVAENGEFLVDVPMLEVHEFKSFLKRENLQGYGALLLVQLDKETDSVDIDASYEAKVFLNSSFRVVEQSQEHDYILFVGATPGNTLIKFRNFRSEIAQKIVHLVEDEMVFEGGATYRRQPISLDLRSLNVLGRNNSVMDVRGSDIRYFNTGLTAQKRSAGQYTLANPYHVLGMRHYFELEQRSGSIFFGTWDQERVYLPSQEFIYYVLDAHSLSSLQNACMVQVNFSKEIVDVAAFGESDRGPMHLIKSFLDNDGYWSGEATEMSKNLFIVGDHLGSISIRVDYVDGTQDNLQTFCSDNTYLIEQL